MTISFANEQTQSLELGSRLVSMEKELRFKIELLGSNLASEKGKTSIDVSSMDARIKGEYADR